jgi:hypothetical protein
VIIRTEVADRTDVTAADIMEIVLAAREEHRAETP